MTTKEKKKVGRPSKRTEEIESKLEYAFSIGSTILGACFYAGISEKTFHNWANEDEEFLQRMNALKEKPILKALETVNKDLEDAQTAKWYLEKKHAEFKPKQVVENTGTLGVAGDILYRKKDK